MRVALLKKAQLAAATLGRKFGTALPAVFGFSAGSLAALTVMADNVLPTVLRAKGVLVPCAALASAVDSGEPLMAGSAQEVALRAGAVVAGARIAAAVERRRRLACGGADGAGGAEEALSEAALDELLWAAGKAPDLRPLPRHATTDTLFY